VTLLGVSTRGKGIGLKKKGRSLTNPPSRRTCTMGGSLFRHVCRPGGEPLKKKTGRGAADRRVRRGSGQMGRGKVVAVSKHLRGRPRQRRVRFKFKPTEAPKPAFQRKGLKKPPPIWLQESVASSRRTENRIRKTRGMTSNITKRGGGDQ